VLDAWGCALVREAVVRPGGGWWKAVGGWGGGAGVHPVGVMQQFAVYQPCWRVAVVPLSLIYVPREMTARTVVR
jgi:hypothetical protein